MAEDGNSVTAGGLVNFNVLWDYARPEESERKFWGLVVGAEASGDRSYHLQLLTQIARAQGLQGKYNEAHATLDGVRDRLTDELKLARARYLLERGRVYNSSGRATEALPLFEEAWRVAAAAGEMRHAVDALHMIAIATPTVEEKVRWNEKCLEVIAGNPGQEGWLPAIYNNLGEAYRARGEYELSLACVQKILELDRAAGREPWIYNRVDEARLLRLVGKAGEAIARMEVIAEEASKGEREDGVVEEEHGECLLAVGRGDEGRGHLVKAYELLRDEEWMRRDEPERWERLKKLAGVG